MCCFVGLRIGVVCLRWCCRVVVSMIACLFVVLYWFVISRMCLSCCVDGLSRCCYVVLCLCWFIVCCCVVVLGLMLCCFDACLFRLYVWLHVCVLGCLFVCLSCRCISLVG